MTQYDLGLVMGSDGNGIASIEKTSTTGLVDTYTITFTDGTTFDFTVTNGEDGSADIVTSWESTLSDEKVPSEKLTKETLDTKANSSSLSTVATSGSYSDLSNKPSIPSSSSDLSDGSDIVKKSNTSGLIKNDGTIDTTSYSTFSGSYSDLSNKPSIPSASSDLSDGSDLIKKSNTTGLVKNDGTIDTTSYISSLPSASTSTSGIVQLVDNLTTSDDNKALTAKQGKALNDLIGTAIAYINE